MISDSGALAPLSFCQEKHHHDRMFMFVLSALLAQEPDCTPRCDNNSLLFCDGIGATTLPCDEVTDGATCAVLSSAWGADCVLPAGATCEPGYAFGVSRCNPPLVCANNDGSLTCGSGPPANTDATPSPGTALGNDIGWLQWLSRFSGWLVGTAMVVAPIPDRRQTREVILLTAVHLPYNTT
jgi:hypothetical protein